MGHSELTKRKRKFVGKTPVPPGCRRGERHAGRQEEHPGHGTGPGHGCQGVLPSGGWPRPCSLLAAVNKAWLGNRERR